MPGIPMVSWMSISDNRRVKILYDRTCRNEINNSARHVGEISLMPRE